MNLFEIKAEIAPAAVEATDDVLLELGVEGWSLLQDVIIGRAWIVGIFISAEEAQTRWAELTSLLPAEAAPAAPVERCLGDQDWRDSYKAHFKAWRCGRLHWVPVWERANHVLAAGETAIWLDPGLAFGTGNHETTRLCVERLVARAEAGGTGGRVIDAGCGYRSKPKITVPGHPEILVSAEVRFTKNLATNGSLQKVTAKLKP
jgi:ribosomal protein L11 methyltransferase